MACDLQKFSGVLEDLLLDQSEATRRRSGMHEEVIALQAPGL